MNPSLHTVHTLIHVFKVRVNKNAPQENATVGDTVFNDPSPVVCSALIVCCLSVVCRSPCVYRAMDLDAKAALLGRSVSYVQQLSKYVCFGSLC